MPTSETFEAKADRLYRFIYTELMEKAKAPSHREMAAELQCSTKTVQKLLTYLEHSGRGLHRVKGCWRRIWVPINEMPPEEGE